MNERRPPKPPAPPPPTPEPPSPPPSRSLEEVATQRDMADKANVIAPPPFLYGASLLLGIVIHVMFPISFLPRNAGGWLGVLLILLSILIVGSAFRALGRAETTFDVRKPTVAIVTDGAFRYSRNPMYLSLTLLYLGFTSLINSLWMLLLVLPLMVVISVVSLNGKSGILKESSGRNTYTTRCGFAVGSSESGPAAAAESD